MRAGLSAETHLAMGRVPKEPFRSIALELMQEKGYAIELEHLAGNKQFKRHEEDELLPASDLAQLARVSERTLQYFLADRNESYEFDFCDALLCALDGPHLWLRDPLREQYLQLDLLKVDVNEVVAEIREEAIAC